ncbi:cob(I)yrinic acid a,c-diamide adenosyltransferase [Methanosarcina spelaei]|uniref:Cob(I)yrinic acid a,c-diamide adenosyltransferase n=1 Tax=Methanosarcina spelaei TaxID=1036679 RepID=A0A2A2HS00_9EURY|nr:cob(I)yrinic acid a,c-diamide adenosyltransferase [Methanosarcina spelaei]PAV12060.1 cob(I)yrinic acid a,c-diamide adenosyltransferase [Methanosarcina spelaei]
MVKGLVYLYTGEGEGKTTNAFGLALRAVGHGYSVIIVQFLKGRKYIGEYKIKDRLAPEYEICQFGREEFVDFKNPIPLDYELAEKGLEFAKKALKRKPRLLILDEINLAAHFGIVKTEDILKLLEKIPKETTVVLTGRRAPEELIKRADLVTEMRLIKHPFEKNVPAREGLEY